MTDRTPTIRAADDAAWRAAIDADPFALPEQSSEWMRAICAGGRFRDVSTSYHFAAGRTFVVPLLSRTPFPIRALAGRWSPPSAWGIGGIVGPPIDAAEAKVIVDDLRSTTTVRTSVRIDARHEDVWQQVTTNDDVTVARRSHIIELGEDPVEHHDALARTTRYNLRRATKKGVEIEIDRTGRLLDTHYALFLLSVRRWAEHQNEPARLALARAKRRDPLSKLQDMSDALGDRFVTVVGRVDGEPAASAILLLGPTARFTRAAMDRELAAPTNAAYAVQWAAIETAYEFGSRRYHMGESGDSDGIGSFKEQFGAVPVDHHEYRFERIPVTATTDLAKRIVKKMIGFRDT